MLTDREQNRGIVQEAARLAQDVVDALTAHVAVLDAEGTIVMVNRAWEAFAIANSPANRANVGVGANYLEVCHRASQGGCEEAARFAEGILAVRAGETEQFILEYPCHSSEQARWFIGRVTRFGAGDALRIVVAHENTTARKRAEQELQQGEARFRQMYENSRRAEEALQKEIAERKRQEALAAEANRRALSEYQKLVESEERFRALIEYGADIVSIMTEAGTIRYQSPTGERVSQHRVEERVGYSILDNIHPEDVPRARALWQSILDHPDQVIVTELRLRDRNGIWHDCEVTLRNLLATPGVHGIVSNARSIAQRKQVEAALRHMEQRFSEVLKNVSLIAIMLDPQGHITFCNEFVLNLTGWNWEEVEGKNWCELFLPADIRDDVLEYYLASVAEGRIHPRYQNEIVTRAGLRRMIAWSNTFLRDLEGRIVAVASLGEDITERQWAEQMLRESEALNRAIVDTAADAIITIDDQSVIQSFNAAAVQMYGYETAEIVGRAMHLLMPEDRQHHYEEYVALFQNAPEPGGLKIRREGIGRRKDGTLFPLEFAASAIQTQDTRLYTAILRDVTERQQAQSIIQRQFERLKALRAIDAVIISSLDLRLTLQFLIDQILRLLDVDAACVLLRSPHTQMLEFASGKGFRVPTRHSCRMGSGEAGTAALERRAVHIPNIREHNEAFANASMMAHEGFISYLAMPLVAKGQTVGVLELYHRAPLRPDGEWRDVLETVSAQAAIAIDNSTLFESLQCSNEELMLAYDATIEGWSRALDLRDKETEGHSRRVTDMTVRLARAMGVDDEELVHIRRGALLHDIGKMGIPDSILLKPGDLTEEEWELMRKHPGYAFDMLSSIAFLRRALDIPYCHHERWDGSGYPRGLKGEQIPLAARIFAVADVWDALRSNRPYREAWPVERVREHLRAIAGRHLDPKIVEIFLDIQDL
jgi:PAS domain S-box-containing protein